MDGTLGFIGGLTSSLLGYAASRNSDIKGVEAVREQNRGNMALAQYQYEKNLEAWNMQNEYNSPASQMARFRAAGLNPNLIYGSGSANSGNATSVPQYSAPRLSAYTDFSREATALSGLMDQVLKAAQVNKTEQETDNLKQYQKNMIVDREYKELQTIAQRYINSKTKAEADIWKEVLDMRLQLMGSEDLLNTYRGQGILLDNQLKEEYGAREYEARINNIKENTRHSMADRVLMQYRASYLAAQTGLAQATANRITTLLPAEERAYLANASYKEIEAEVYKNAREWGVDPSNHSEVGTAVNFLIAMYNNNKTKIKGNFNKYIKDNLPFDISPIFDIFLP